MARIRILVVDDEAGVTRSLKLNLENLGTYEVRTENRSTQALKTARDFKPDLILLDVMMPEMDGGVIKEQLEADSLLRDVPVVFLTAILSKDETAGHEAVIGGMHYLAKPVDLAELTQCLEKHLAK
jgi:CheY-like chemotaxis protein